MNRTTQMKRRLSLFLVLTMLVTPFTQLKASAQQTESVAQSMMGETAEGKPFTVEMQTDSIWGNGYHATVTIRNTGDSVIDNWYLELRTGDTIEHIWNASVWKKEDGHYIIKNAQWNQDIEPGGSVSFGFTAGYEGEISQVDFLGMPMGTTPVEETSYLWDYNVDNELGTSFYNAGFSISNLTGEPLEDWVVEFDFEGTIDTIWNGEIVSYENNHYVIKNATHNQNIAGNDTVCFGFNGTKQENVIAEPRTVKVYQVNYDEDFRNSDKETGEEAPGDVSGGDVPGGDVSGGDVSGGDILPEDTDTDGDGITDATEAELGFDPYSPDSDGDGLPDGYELYTLYPIQLHRGYSAEAPIYAFNDYDHDGLDNLEEYQAGTNPGNADTDGDGVGDREELVTHGTVPLLPDTDGDGLNDGLEIRRGMNPLHQDSDADGVPDGEEIVSQQLMHGDINSETLKEAGTIPILYITGSGDFSRKLEIVDIAPNTKYGHGGYLVGSPYDFRHEEELFFEEAIITFYLSEEVLAANNISDLAIAWYDEENEQIEIQDTTCGSSGNNISAEVTHFSTYMVINKRLYLDSLYRAYYNQQKVYDPDSGKAYILVDDYLSWEEAEAYCESLGGHLVTIDSEEEQGFVDALVTENGTREHYFLGLSDTDEKLIFSNGVPITYEEWEAEHAALAGKKYEYTYYSEEKYLVGNRTNRIYSYNIESDFPLFVFKYGSGFENGNIPVTYYRILAFDEKYEHRSAWNIDLTYRNYRMERYIQSYSFTYSPSTGESIFEVTERLHQLEEKAVVPGNGSYLFGPNCYIMSESESKTYGGANAYTTFHTNIPTFDNYGAVRDYFINENARGQVNSLAIPYTKMENHVGYICEFEEEPEECSILLSSGETVILDADPSLGDETTDTDGDGVVDIVELGEEVILTIPGTDIKVSIWNFRSNPAVPDTDGDGFTDSNDPAPGRFDLTVEAVYGDNVIRLNTGAVYCIFGRDIDEFYEQYYTCGLDFNRKEILEALMVQLNLNHEKDYTVEETAFLCNIDMDGVKDYLVEYSSPYKRMVYEELTGETCPEAEAEDFFSIIGKKEAWISYLKVAVEQMIAGKYTDKGNLLGTLGEIGIAFTGADIVQDIRDLSHDIIYWEDSWEHLGETILDGVAVIPVVGVFGKTDEMYALLNRGNNLLEIRRIKYADKLLTGLDELKYMTSVSELAGTAQNVAPKFGASLYRDVLNTCESVSEYKSLYSNVGSYDNAVISALSERAEDLKYLGDVDGDLLEGVVKEAAQSGRKSTEELKELLDEAIDEAKERAEEIEEEEAKIEEIINSIPEKYKVNGKCNEFAEILAERLDEEGIEHDKIKVESRYGIYSDKAKELIGNGFHYGIRVGNKIYDNMTLEGIEFSEWLEDLGLTSQPKEIIDWRIVDVILPY